MERKLFRDTKEYWVFFLSVFLLSVLIRMYFGYSCGIIVGGDGRSYSALGEMIFHKGVCNPSWLFSFDTFRPPVYPLFIAIVYTLFGKSMLAVALSQAVLGACIPVLIGLIAVSVYDDIVVCGASLLAALYPGFIFLSNLMMSELLGTLLLLVSILFYIRWLSSGEKPERRKILLVVLSGFCMGLAVLTRAIFLPFVVFVPIITGIVRAGNVIKERALVHVSVFFVVAILTILPWTVRNYVVHDEIIPVTSQTGITFYSSYILEEGQSFGYLTYNDETRFAYTLSTIAERNDYLIDRTISFIRENPGKTVKREVQKILLTACPIDWAIIASGDDTGAYNVFFASFFPLFILGFWFTFRSKSEGKMFIAWFVLSYIFILMVFYSSPRLRIVIEPFLVLMSVYSVGMILQLKRRALYLTAVSIWVACQVLIAWNFLFVKDLVKSVVY